METIPVKQKNLSLADLREIFQQIDTLANKNLNERVILQSVVESNQDYELKFLRWLVRHTIHPETDDDIMSDEITQSVEKIANDGSTLTEINFSRIPPTIKDSYLVQFKHTFWHVIKFDPENKTATLKLLSDYAAT